MLANAISAVYGEKALACSLCFILVALLVSAFWKLNTCKQRRLRVSGKTLLGHTANADSKGVFSIKLTLTGAKHVVR